MCHKTNKVKVENNDKNYKNILKQKSENVRARLHFKLINNKISNRKKQKTLHKLKSSCFSDKLDCIVNNKTYKSYIKQIGYSET